jgi:uncharacterized protein (TIGR03437 family)
MKLLLTLPLLIGVLAIPAAVRPTVNQGGVLNAASYGLDLLPNNGVAQGSMFVVFGSALGPTTLTQASGFPLPTSLGGTSIQVISGSTTVNAIMLYTSTSQVAAILPSTTPIGFASLTLTYNNQASASVSIQVVGTNFGIFSRSQTGGGPAVVQNYVSGTQQPLNSPLAPANPGQVMILWGTGLGASPGSDALPPAGGNLPVAVQVWVGNQQATVQYSGRSPQFPGIDQINFQLPNNVPLGCYVPLAINAAGRMSNFTTIAIASQGNICSDPHGQSSADLTRIAGGATLKVGWIQLVRYIFHGTIAGVGTVDGTADTGWGDFFQMNQASLGSDSPVDHFAGIALGTCYVFSMPVGGMAPVRSARLNVGAALNLQGSEGSRVMPPDRNGMYDKNALGGTITPAIFTLKNGLILDPGAFSVDNGSGAAALGAFHANLTIPQTTTSIQWTNFNSISTIARSQDLTITWTGGDDTQEFVMVGASVSVPGLIAQKAQAMVIVGCAQRPSAGKMVIPAAILSALPATGSDPSASSLAVVRAPLLESSRVGITGLDAAYLSYAQINENTVTYK